MLPLSEDIGEAIPCSYIPSSLVVLVIVLPMNTRSMSFHGRDGLRAVRLIIWPHNMEKKWDGTEAVPP
jgi:hypothetical protein